MTAPVLWAVDGGGTTTTVDVDGERTTYGSVNPASVGPEAAYTALVEILTAVAERLSGHPGTGWFATAACGLPPDGETGRLITDRAQRAGVRGTVWVSNDIVPWLVAPPLDGRGVALVCGTGSGFLAGDGHGLVHRTGGCEYLGSDEGSAFQLGMGGLRAAVRAADGRGPATALVQRLADRFGVGVQEGARRLAQLPHPKGALAELAPVVCDAWTDGDRVAQSLVTEAVDGLVAGVRAAALGARLTGRWPVAIGGGVLRGSPAFSALLSRRLTGELQSANVVELGEPVEVALAALRNRQPDDHDASIVGLARRFDIPDTAPRSPDRRAAASESTHIGQRITLGVCLAAWGKTDLSAAVADAVELGAEAIDLPTDSTASLVDLARWARDPEYRHWLRAVTRKVPVTCVSNSRDAQLLLGPHGGHTDPVASGPVWSKRGHALDYAMDTVRVAADLGAPHVRLMFGVQDHARWLSWSGSAVSWQDNVAAWCDHTEPVLALADEYGVTVLVEPHPKQTAYDPESARQLLDAAEAAGRSVGLCLDPANLAAVGYHPAQAVRGWDSRLMAVHAKDLQRWTGTGRATGAGWSRYGPGPAIRFRALGAGELPWAATVSALLDEGFGGVLYVEHEDALLPRNQSVRNSLGYLRALLPQSVPEGRTW